MKIHFIAIGGSIMHSLAIELKKNGHLITGSDDVIHEPSKSNLIKNNLFPDKEGWSIKNINSDLDLVILGMHAKKNNPELLESKKINIPILSFPEFIFNYSKKKKRIVICGSHGKTTITSIIIHVLHKNNIKTDYLVGAKIDILDQQVKLENNNSIIIEGDEYFSSAIDNTPKFMHYNPNIIVVSGVAWDHINVFPTLSSYTNAFKKLLNQVIEKSGKIFYCNNDFFLSNFFKNKNPKFIGYSLPKYIVKDGQFILIHNSEKIPLKIFGKHNLYNIEAAKYICKEFGVDEDSFYLAIKSFKGAFRRLTLMDINKKFKNHSSVYYDFAHSPSKVLATVNAIKELHPNRYLIVCLELYTFSSLNKEFLPNYLNILSNCDKVCIYLPKKELARKGVSNIDSDFVKHAFGNKNIHVIKNKSLLKNWLLRIQLYNTNLLLMSSGNFSNLNIEKIFK